MVAFEGRNLPGKHFEKENVSIVCTRAWFIPFFILNFPNQVAKKIIFTGCHSGKLKLTLTSPDVISTSPKAFWRAELISQFFCFSNSSKKITCPSGKLKTEFTSPIAKSTSPGLSDTALFARCKYRIGVNSFYFPLSPQRLASWQSTYLKKVKSHYNYCLIAPEKNLVTKQDCQEVTGFRVYLDRYEDQSLGCTIAYAKRGGLYQVRSCQIAWKCFSLA